MVTAVRIRAPGGADQLENVTIGLPPPQAGEIRIRHQAWAGPEPQPLPAAAVPSSSIE